MIDGLVFTRAMVEELEGHGKKLSFQSKSGDISSIVSKSKLMGKSIIELAKDMLAVISDENILVCSPLNIYLANSEYDEGLFMFTSFAEIDLRNTCLLEPIDLTRMFYKATAEYIDMTGLRLTRGSKCSKMFAGFVGNVKADDCRIQRQVQKYVRTQEEVDIELQEEFERGMKAFIETYASEDDD